jgi:hypothetical protein
MSPGRKQDGCYRLCVGTGLRSARKPAEFRDTSAFPYRIDSWREVRGAGHNALATRHVGTPLGYFGGPTAIGAPPKAGP